MGDSIIVDSMENDHEITFVGHVLGLDGNPIEGATLDVWETASNGFYDVQDGDQTAMNMRGIFTTGSDGRYEIRGIRPVPSQIPGDDPAGICCSRTAGTTGVQATCISWWPIPATRP